jgi:hypothetical protein
LYAVLESKVETAKGKEASLISVKILDYITSAKIGDGSWHGTLRTSFSTGKSKSVCMSGSPQLVATSQMSRNKLTMLQTAVHPLQKLRQVKATAALLKVHTTQDLGYEAYTSLLLSTASDYDNKHVSVKVKDRCMHMISYMRMQTYMMHHMKWTVSI